MVADNQLARRSKRRSVAKFRSPELLETGWFSELEGPFGQVPVQFTATLVTGEFVYFRGRGKNVSLEIYPSREDEQNERNIIARYAKDYPLKPASALADDEVDFGAGVMAVDESVDLIKEWVSTYLRHCKQAQEVSAQADTFVGVDD